MSDPDVHGTVRPGFERVADAFRRGFDRRPTMGAAVSVRIEGETVVDLWAGIADERDGRPWQDDTASVIFSCTKGLMSILVARLVEDGRLDYDAPVSRYWPEFAAAGKEGVTVAELVSHRAGLSALRQPLALDDLLVWGTVPRLLAAEESLWEPGTGYSYHALTHGWLTGELVRRITGEQPGAAFARLMRPWASDAWIGVPQSEEHRVAHLQLSESQRAAARASEAEPVRWNLLASTLGGALPAEMATPDGGFNDPRVHAAQLPGAGGIATARALASIWSATVTPTDGVRLLSDDTLDVALVPMSSGEPVFPTPGPWPVWARGFMVRTAADTLLGPRSFGHDGAGGQLGFADRDAAVGFGYVTNWMEAGDRRSADIVDALRTALA